MYTWITCIKYTYMALKIGFPLVCTICVIWSLCPQILLTYPRFSDSSPNPVHCKPECKVSFWRFLFHLCFHKLPRYFDNFGLNSPSFMNLIFTTVCYVIDNIVLFNFIFWFPICSATETKLNLLHNLNNLLVWIKYNRCCLIEEVNNTRGRVDQTYEKVDQTKGQKLRD